MMHESFGVRKHLAKIFIVFSALAVVFGFGLLGCRIIEPFWTENKSEGILGQIGQYTIAGEGALDIRSDDFRIVIPPGAAADGTSLTISMVYEPPAIFGTSHTTQPRVLPPDGFVKLSTAYDVTISPSSTILARPARLELPFQPDSTARTYPDSIMVACFHETDGWSVLVPAIDLDRGLAVVETTRFGRWMVVRPVDSGYTFPRLTIAAVPETLIASYGHSFSSDIVMTYTVMDINPGSIVSNELTILGVNGILPPGRIPGSSDSRAFVTDAFGHVVLALNNSPYIGQGSSGGSPLYTLRFATSGLNPGNLADRLVMRWAIKLADGLSFIREYSVTLTEAAIPASDQSTGTPQLVAFSPRDTAVDVPAFSPIEMTFDLEMNRESVTQAITVSPSPGAFDAVWADNRHLMLTFPASWPAETVVTVSLATSAESLGGVALAREYGWSFAVRSASQLLSPRLASIAPASGSLQVAINTRILLRFSKPMSRSSVEAAIVGVKPAIDRFTFEWSADYTGVGILPTALWAANTDHEIEIASAAADTDGLSLGGPVRFTFHTSEKSGPTVALIEPAPDSVTATSPYSLKFQFSRTMNKTLTAGAFSVIPAPGGTPSFGWASSDSELSITWAGVFPQGREIIASFSPAARDSLNLPLSGTTLFRFFTRDSTPPRIVSAIPSAGSTGISRNAPIELTFSETMNRTTVEAAIVVSPVMGGLSYQWDSTGTRLTITPAQPWPANSQILLTAGTSAADESGNKLIEQFILAFSSVSTFAPALAASNPSPGATGVSRSQPLTLTFSQPMLSDSLAGALIIAPPASDGVSITWNADSTIATVNPRPSWPNAALVTATLGKSAKSSTGIELIATASVSFTTVDTEPPSVVSLTPANGAVEVSTTASLTIGFSEPMNEAAVLAAVSLTPAAVGIMRSRVSNGGRLFEISWSQPLGSLTAHTLTIHTTACDMSGNQLTQPISSIFTTIDPSFSDTTPPVILSGQEVPLANSTFVASSTVISLPFSTAMNAASVVSAFSLRTGAGQVAGTPAWESDRFIFTPAAPLGYGLEYEIRVANSAARDNGVRMSADWVATFTTAPRVNPVILSTVPAAGATNVPAHQDIVLEFSAPMATETVTVTVAPEPIGQRTNSWSDDLHRLTVSYTGGYSNNTSYQISVGNGARNVFGTAISGNLVIEFTSEATTAPKVLAVSPTPGATGIQRTTSVSLTFDKAMERVSTLAALTVTPAPGESPTISWNSGDTVVTLNWPSGLMLGTRYTVQLAGTARSATGAELGTEFSTHFTVESRPQVVSGSEYPAPGAINVATDTVVRMIFSKPMNQNSASSAFGMTAGGNVVSGAITWDDTMMTFTPANKLPDSATCIVTVSASAPDSNGNTLAAPVSWQFNTLTPSVTPILSSTVPGDGATNVPAHQNIVLEFSAPMATPTVSVTIAPEGLGQRTNTWSGDLRRLTIAYTGGFSSSTPYRIIVGAGAKNAAGTTISGDLESVFTSEALAAPKVLAISPAIGATEVQRTTSLTLTFDTAMERASTIAALTMTPAPGESPTIAWSSGDTGITLSWPGGLTAGTVYTVQLAETARSAAGVVLGTGFSSYFTVESRPQVVSGSEYPAPDSITVGTDTVVRMRFSKPMNQASVTSAFSMTAGGSPVSGAITWADTTMTFTPAAALPASTTCIVTVSTSALDGSGNTLVAPVSWEFDTVTLAGTVWRQVLASDFTATDRFSPRRGHATISFNNRLWVIGGTDGTTFFNDVWSSADGNTWNLEMAPSNSSGTTQFGGRTNHACAVFNGRIWLTGGYIDTGEGIDVIDDVWSSADGKNWQRESEAAEYWARGDHSMFVYDGKLWLVAGQTYDTDGLETLLNDAWYSSDGVHWTETSLISAYFPRRSVAAGVIDGKMFIWGGYGTDAAGAAGPLGDIWYSTNGAHWTLSTVSAPFTARQGAAHAVINGKVWMIGGYGISPSGYDECLNDVWVSGDGVAWQNILPHDPSAAERFSPRHQSGISQAGGRIFLVGGEELYDILNDIWTFD